MPYTKAVQTPLLAVLFFVAGALSFWLMTDQSEDVVSAGSKYDLRMYTHEGSRMLFDPQTGDTWVLRSRGWRYYKPPKRPDESTPDAELRQKVEEELKRRGIHPGSN